MIAIDTSMIINIQAPRNKMLNSWTEIRIHFENMREIILKRGDVTTVLMKDKLIKRPWPQKL
jgi:hypothetical protein